MNRVEFIFVRLFSDVVKRRPRPGFSSAIRRVDIFNDNVIVIAELLIVLGQAVLKRRAFVTSSTRRFQIFRNQFISIHIALKYRFPLHGIDTTTAVIYYR